MHAECVKGVVVTQPRFEADRDVANDAGEQADDEPSKGKDKTRGGRDRGQTATRPEANPRAVGLPRSNHSASIQARAAVAPATWVAVNAETASCPLVGRCRR